jgi:hypothetical protein
MHIETECPWCDEIFSIFFENQSNVALSGVARLLKMHIKDEHRDQHEEFTVSFFLRV